MAVISAPVPVRSWVLASDELLPVKPEAIDSAH